MTTTAGQGFDAERLGRLDSVLHGYVDKGKIPGVQTLVSRRGELVHRDCYGYRDVEQERAVEPDTLYRIYSMTKPITSVALMMLYEEGHFLMENPVSRWIPELADLQVWTGGTEDAPETRPLTSPLTVHHVLTHTSGLTYGFQFAHPVDAMYRAADLGNFTSPDYDLQEAMARLGQLPLQFEPGTSWNYSMSTDVCGRLVEVMSGLTLDEFFRTPDLRAAGHVRHGLRGAGGRRRSVQLPLRVRAGQGHDPDGPRADDDDPALDALRRWWPRQLVRRLPALLPPPRQRRRARRGAAARHPARCGS